MKGYRRTIWIDDEMDKAIHSAPDNLNFNAKIKYIMCGDTPGDTQNASGDAPNIEETLINMQDQIDMLLMWKADVE